MSIGKAVIVAVFWLSVITHSCNGEFTVTLFQHKEFQGLTLSVTFGSGFQCFDIPSSQFSYFNDITSSIATAGRCVILYEHAGCEGTYIEVYPGTKSHNRLGNLSYPKSGENWNDRVSSLSRC